MSVIPFVHPNFIAILSAASVQIDFKLGLEYCRLMVQALLSDVNFLYVAQ